MGALDAATDAVRTTHASDDVHEVLQHPPSVLLGVSAQAEQALGDLEIETIFDLACSRTFAAARSLVDAAEDPRSPLARAGVAPADIVETATPVAVEHLRFEPATVLRDVAAAGGPALLDRLGVTTVRDLALWPPYVAARALLNRAYGGGDAEPDPEAPADLLPRNGDYPTERVVYKTLVTGDSLVDADELADLEAGGRATVAGAAAAGAGRPRRGAEITISQSWYPLGVALGTLLHSVALAPGESTRIAVIDWSRRSSASQAETGSEAEDLTNATTHGRAISEVQNAVATESQAGFSQTSGTSTTEQAGGGIGFSAGPITLGGSASGGTTTSSGTSASSSNGRREIAAEMTQNVQESTHQHATAVRNRRASVVKEVAQSEHEHVSTRVIANYNHMHALTVQYYEVVQIYRTRVRVERVRPVLFMPVDPPAFEDEREIDDLRPHIDGALAAIDPRVKLGRYFDAIVKPMPSPEAPEEPVVARGVAGMRAGRWNVAALHRAGERLGVDVVAPEHAGVRLPAHARIKSVQVRGARGATVALEDVSGAPVAVEARSGALAGDATVADLSSLTVTGADPAGGEALVALRVELDGREAEVEVPVALREGRAPTPAIAFDGPADRSALLGALRANRAQIGQAMLARMSGPQVVQSLSHLKLRGAPLTDVVDSTPLALVGNDVVLGLHEAIRDTAGERTDWGEWLEQHGLLDPAVREDVVPLPSAGIFAEAVLGRFNSAEKLDLTRFWNWQDSPPPLAATDIAAIQTGSRATPEDTKPGEFSQPLVNIVSPTALPDPAGLGAVLATLARGDMFRDMSGMVHTAGLARALAEQSAAAATNAGALAADNLRVAAQKEVEMAKTAVAAMQAMMGNPNAATGSGGNISERGALVQHGRAMDERGVPAPGGANGAAPAMPSGGTPAEPGGDPVDSAPGGAPSPGGGDGGWNGVTPHGNEQDAFQAALWGPAGASAQDLFQPAQHVSSPAAPAVPARSGPLSHFPTWDADKAAATTSAQKAALLAKTYGVTVVDKSGGQPQTGEADASKLVPWDSANPTFNYVEQLAKMFEQPDGKPSARGGRTIARNGKVYVLLGANALLDGAGLAITLANHELDHVRELTGGAGGNSEHETWTTTFVRTFAQTYDVFDYGTHGQLTDVPRWSQLSSTATTAKADKQAAFGRIASFYKGLAPGSVTHALFLGWLAMQARREGQHGDWAKQLVARLGGEAIFGGKSTAQLWALSPAQLSAARAAPAAKVMLP